MADQWADLREWLEELEDAGADNHHRAGQIALPLIDLTSQHELMDRVGRERADAFFALAREEYRANQEYLARFLRYGGQKFEQTEWLEQANEIEEKLRSE